MLSCLCCEGSSVPFFPINAFKAAFNEACDHANNHCIAQGFSYQICLLRSLSSNVLQKVLNNQQKLFLVAINSNWRGEASVVVCFAIQRTLSVSLFLASR